MKQTINPEELKVQLLQFSGTEHYYEHSTIGSGKLLLTDGCKYLREVAKCYWLFDLFASYQYKLCNEDFQTWTLVKTKSNGWEVSATDGNDKKLVTQYIPFSDFVIEDGFTIFLTDGVAMLPSEY